MRLLLIVNPTASSMTPKRRVRVQRQLGQHHRLEVAETYRRGHATRIARAAARDGMDAVVVAAGDGTLNEAADGLIGTETALAPLPGGSTNVFARTLGIRNSIMPATEQLVASLDAESMRRIGVGEANGRHFLFHLGCGYDAEVIEQVERRTWLKRWVAHPMFAMAAVTTFFRGIDREHPPFHVITADGSRVDDGYFAIVSNTKPYAFFGPRPLLVTNDAGFDRALALTMFTRLEASSTLSAAGSAMVSGTRLGKNEAVVQRSDLDAMTVVANHGPFPWQVDGDYLGEVERIEIRYLRDALRVVEPLKT